MCTPCLHLKIGIKLNFLSSSRSACLLSYLSIILKWDRHLSSKVQYREWWRLNIITETFATFIWHKSSVFCWWIASLFHMNTFMIQRYNRNWLYIICWNYINYILTMEISNNCKQFQINSYILRNKTLQYNIFPTTIIIVYQHAKHHK